MSGQEYVQELVRRAKDAQKTLETYSQKKTDKIVRMFAKIVFDYADPLAKMAAGETGSIIMRIECMEL